MSKQNSTKDSNYVMKYKTLLDFEVVPLRKTPLRDVDGTALFPSDPLDTDGWLRYAHKNHVPFMNAQEPKGAHYDMKTLDQVKKPSAFASGCPSLDDMQKLKAIESRLDPDWEKKKRRILAQFEKELQESMKARDEDGDIDVY